MKKALKFLLVLSVFAAFLIGASTMAMAENPNEKKVTIGDSEITITSDKGFSVPLPGNTNAGVKVTFQLTSDNSPITEVCVWDDYEYYNSNSDSVTYTHEYKYMDVESNVMRITLKDGSSAELLYCPIILPASYLSGDISLKTDPTGLAIEASGYKVKNGPEYLIKVYKDAARTESQCIAKYTAKTEGGPVSILKKNNSWYKPNTKYYLSIYPLNYYEGKPNPLPGNPTNRTIQTSPTVNPVIKSVKISNVKVKAYRPNPLSTVVRYKTTYKMTITLSKKASNIKGIKVKAGLGEYTAKGTGKVFTINCVNDSGVSYKGTKQKMKVMTYSASASYGYALSGQTKYKTYTIKNGTY